MADIITYRFSIKFVYKECMMRVHRRVDVRLCIRKWHQTVGAGHQFRNSPLSLYRSLLRDKKRTSLYSLWGLLSPLLSLTRPRTLQLSLSPFSLFNKLSASVSRPIPDGSIDSSELGSVGLLQTRRRYIGTTSFIIQQRRSSLTQNRARQSATVTHIYYMIPSFPFTAACN